MLPIEVDGESHYTQESKERDRERTQRLEGYGLTVVRFTNQQVLCEFEKVCEEMQGLIPPSPPLRRGENMEAEIKIVEGVNDGK